MVSDKKSGHGMPAQMRGMVLAAGLGRRLAPLTDTTPKPLVRVAGRHLIDYAFDLLRGAGLQKVVVNCHYLAEQVMSYVAGVDDLDIAISDERGSLLETGGGVQKALPLLGDQPFAVLNSDVILRREDHGSLKALIEYWDPDVMDVLLLLQGKDSAVGFDGAGDFYKDAEGRLRRPTAGDGAPYIFAGVQIVNPDLFDGIAPGKFSMNVIFDKAAAHGRLFGLPHDGQWLHVGTEQALAEAEQIIDGQK